MLKDFLRCSLFGAIILFLTAGMATAPVSAKGIVLILNVIDFLKCESLEKGIAISPHLVEPDVQVFMLVIPAGPGLAVRASNGMVVGCGPQP
jgi:hypothetical protein